MESQLNDLITDFVNLYTDLKQKDANWYKIMGTTVGGSELASIMGLNPYSSFYDVVESKIKICKGIKQENINNVSCCWGTLFENVITRYVSIDFGNKVKGTKICIQKYEGHRTSPDGYVVVNLYLKDGKYNLWTTDLSRDDIVKSIILMLEFKCPITRKVTGNIPNYYKPQVLSGLEVSPIAHKGLFIDAVFRKCSLDQLGNNVLYDTSFHKKSLNINPIAWGIIPICISDNNISDNIKSIYEEYFNFEFNADETNLIDMGDIDISLFEKIMFLINENKLLPIKSTMTFLDGRGDKDIYQFKKKTDFTLFAMIPWKLFDVSYVPVEREVGFLDKIYPKIQEVHKLVKECLEKGFDNSLKSIEIYEDLGFIN